MKLGNVGKIINFDKFSSMKKAFDIKKLIKFLEDKNYTEIDFPNDILDNLYRFCSKKSNILLILDKLNLKEYENSFETEIVEFIKASFAHVENRKEFIDKIDTFKFENDNILGVIDDLELLEDYQTK